MNFSFAIILHHSSVLLSFGGSFVSRALSFIHLYLFKMNVAFFSFSLSEKSLQTRNGWSLNEIKH